ncbi:uncharacterized protein LOC120456019 [Drosophila santomea]|uniref:uncharacterized protein LOC120456019 n=1 Tax=Drosophila santomea TaxID=129105 RepID=UPI00195404F3|nr:uncharacterized protein LOC120456019 [Drosophila santomea]
MVWNTLSFWDGQPVTSPVYPQMGDVWSLNTSGYQRYDHPQTHTHTHTHSPQNYYQRMGNGMGDIRQMSCPMPNYCPHFREPGLDDVDAFYAYNGMDVNQAYGGGSRPGQGAGSGGRGDLW